MFECTQKLECTQDLSTQSLRECPEQIGFLGICGKTYPVKKGPNKIGRDPQTCGIVLNLNSVSRQHAVINVLNKKDFMLMDLDSANKTKLSGKYLMPYVPQPLKNGDMVQFGEIFGIFRLLEEEDDLAMTQALPMTQVMSIPDTPVPTRHVSKLASAMTVPESPDVSDKDDSFIIPSQPNGPQFKTSKTNFIKPGKTISIQPIGGNKIDNVYWNSSKKSTSLILNDSSSSLNDSLRPLNINEKENEANASNIHEMDTQAFPPKLIETDLIFEANTQRPESPIPPSIYSANTQLPGSNLSSPSKYTANTQLPVSNNTSPSIYSANTQLPEAVPSPSIHNLSTQMPLDENLPEVCKINEQQDMHLNLFADKNMYDADTQMFPPISPIKSTANNISLRKKSSEDSKQDRSRDIVFDDDIEIKSDDEGLESQAICTEGLLEPITINSVETEPEPLSQIALPKSAKRNRIKSDSSIDTDDNDDDILLSQKKTNPENRVNGEDDLTDYEEENMIELEPDKKINNNVEVIDLEEVTTQGIKVVETLPNDGADLEDMSTQKIPAKQTTSVDKVDGRNIDFEDLPTQVLVDDIVPPKICKKLLPISDEVEISPFKVPLKSEFKTKKKDFSSTPKIKPIANVESKPANDERYYENTQELYEDLLSQQSLSPGAGLSTTSVDKVDGKDIDFEDLPTQVLVDDIVPPKICKKLLPVSDEVEISPFKVPLKSAFKTKKKDVSKTPKIKPIANVESKPANDEQYYQITQDLYEDLCSQKTLSPGAGLSGVKSLDDKSKDEALNNSESSTSDIEEKIDNFVAILTSPEVRDIIGAETKIATLKKTSSLGSDSSDLEKTPKKIRPFKFMDIDLPDSQEIKTSVSHALSKSIVTESSSESENELNSEDQCTPILFRKKKKTKSDAKMDLTKRFDVDALPTRVITRVRKPTTKVQDLESKRFSNSILKPTFLTEQDQDVDRDIITENITRLKSKSDKSKNSKDTSKEEIKHGTTKTRDDKKDIKKETSSKTSPNTKKTSHGAIDSIDDAQKHVSHNVVKESKSLTITGKKTPTEEIIARESGRKNKLTIENSKDLKDTILKKDQEKTSEPNKAKFEKTLTNDNKEQEPNLKARNLTSKVKEEKSRGPIMIDPHTITIPIKGEKKKRVYNRSNKEPPLNDTNKVGEDKSSDSKSDNAGTKRPVRSTRGKKRMSEDYVLFPDAIKDEKPKQIKKDAKEPSREKEKPKRTSTDSKEPSPEKEIRRSSRQKTVKEKEQPKEPQIKSILKKTSIHEQSTVYNLSTETNSDTSYLKRSAEFDIPEPMAKRTRAASRATPNRTNKTCYILFTIFPLDGVKAKLESLGAVIVTDLKQCTVLATLEVRRTFKLMCAVGLGKPIVGQSWVEACLDTNMIVDPWLYTIKDEAAEKRFNFNLERTLRGPRGFLKGFNVSATPNVVPKPSEMKVIVQCSGGTWKEGGANWLCLSTVADHALWPALHKRGAILVTTEAILGGVLRQALDIESARISMH